MTMISSSRSIQYVAVLTLVMALVCYQVESFTNPGYVTRQTLISANTATSRSSMRRNMIAADPSVIAASSLVLAETEAWVQPVATVLDPTLNFLAFAMLCRVVISWYPNQNVNEFPFNIVAWPTEPLLRLIRGAIPPAFGVDITPIVWFGIFTFFHEIFLGQQGLFTMKLKYGM